MQLHGECVRFRDTVSNEFMAKKICRELEIDEPGEPKKPEQGEPSDAADSR
jgi:hypothetical protein